MGRLCLRLPTQPIGLGEGRTRGGVVGRHHWVVLWQIPLGSVLIWRHAKASQMPFQRLELLAVIQADEEIRRDRLLDRH